MIVKSARKNITRDPAACSDCALCLSSTQVVLPTPCPSNGLLCVGEAPGADEDAAGEGFVGAAGRRLDTLLANHGLYRGRDFGVANICRCRPEANRKPTKIEIAACLPKLVNSILQMRPKVLLLVGAVPSNAFLRPGALSAIIRESGRDGYIDPAFCRPEIQPLAHLNLRAIPMPHTSGMAWHRKAHSSFGDIPWSAIGEQQVSVAVEQLKGEIA